MKQPRKKTFQIKPAIPQDVPALLEMIHELARFERLEDEVEATLESLLESLFGPHPVAGALLARHGNQLAGYAIYFFTFSSFVGRAGLWLDDLYVRPAFRRKGLGRELLLRTAEVAARHRCGRLEWTALRWNEGALRFYEEIGARRLKEWITLRLGESGIKSLASGKDAAPAQRSSQAQPGSRARGAAGRHSSQRGAAFR